MRKIIILMWIMWIYGIAMSLTLLTTMPKMLMGYIPWAILAISGTFTKD